MVVEGSGAPAFTAGRAGSPRPHGSAVPASIAPRANRSRTMPHRCLRFVLVPLLSLAAAAAAIAQPRPPTALGMPPALDIWRPPVLVAAGAEQPVRLQALQVEVDVAGRIAQTRVRMTFFNPNPRLLEGKLQFPLAEGQSITGFALDVDGGLRDAVPADKARA